MKTPTLIRQRSRISGVFAKANGTNTIVYAEYVVLRTLMILYLKSCGLVRKGGLLLF